MAETGVTVVGKPNPDAVAAIFDSIQDWLWREHLKETAAVSVETGTNTAEVNR